MLDTLKMVRGAVSDKDIVSVLTHFCIYGGRIQGSNGRVYIDCPCPELAIDAVIPAERFLRAVDACKGEPEIHTTEGGKVSIKRGKFRALLPAQKVDAFPRGEPSKGDAKKVGPGLLDALRILRAFISLDAERPWASSIFFSKGTAYATNSAMIAMVDCTAFKDDIQVPVFGIDELLRISIPPEKYSVDPTSVTFFWGDRWMKSQLLTADWPLETARKWLDTTAKTQAIPPELAGHISELKAFCNDLKFPVIYFTEKGIHTAQGESQAEVGGYNFGVGALHADNLLPMLAQADRMVILDSCALFTGRNFKGIMAKLRMNNG